MELGSPKYASSFDGYARKPRNKDVIVLTASDGLGHNSEIPNLLDKVLDDRAKYCAKHGYTNLWLNTSRYDVGDSHRVIHDSYSQTTGMTPQLTCSRCGPRSPLSQKHSTCIPVQNGYG